MCDAGVFLRVIVLVREPAWMSERVSFTRSSAINLHSKHRMYGLAEARQAEREGCYIRPNR
jgi:hypothetical protein